MDETDSPQNRSNDDAEISKSSNENSFMGKMKFGVSKIIPNSLSKFWQSPKVDVSNARRRRHEEMDSEDEGSNRNESPLAIETDSRYQAPQMPQLGAPPPNKKKKTFTDFLNRNTPDLYSSTATPTIGDRSNIISSTMIEDVPHRTNDHFNRFLPLENGQHAASTLAFGEDAARDNASNYPDEASSSQSREKPTNIFAINNDSSVVNFSAHLQRAKSLFTNRSYISPRLKNYRMRNPRSSLYRSTSSLCDNNSVSSNASNVSAMSSPFYNGQTTFGGASAISRRLNTTLNQDLPLLHRPKVPTNLVTSRSTSSLSTISGSSASMSTTAKRILDVMSKYNTPLTEVRRISNALPSISETSALNTRKSILELDTTTNENDKSKRMLLKPNTPYNRPFGRNPVESVLTTELHVPSMPELLQLKKFATNTMKIRDIAGKSDSVLNKPVATHEFKMSHTIPHQAAAADGDLDASNNNKFVNNKNDAISNSASDLNKHKNKIRTKITKPRLSKRVDDVPAPEPLDLPTNPLVLDAKAEIKFPEPFKWQNSDQKTTTGNGIQAPFKSKNSNTSSIVTLGAKEKRTNGNDVEVASKFEISSSKTSSVTVPAQPISTIANFTNKPQPVLNNSKPSFTYHFNEPIVIKATSNSFEQHKGFANKLNYKFSEPFFVGDKTDGFVKTDATQSFSNVKFESKEVTRDSGIETTQSFDSNANQSTGLFGAKSVIATSTDNGFGVGKSVSSLPTELHDNDSFKSLAAKQKQGKWECKDCLTLNDSSLDKCSCCMGAKEKKVEKAGSAATATTTVTSVVSSTDDVFKSIVAKQKQSKWECQDCLSHNDQAQPKCISCGGANPKASSNVTVNNTAAPPKSAFSFGTLPSSSSTSANQDTFKPLDSSFKAIVDKQKSTWECSACGVRNDLSKSKCACCEQSRVSKGENEVAAPKPTFSFGSGNATTALPQSGFSFGSSATTVASTAKTFSFGNLAAQTAPTAQISFGSTKTNGSNTDKAAEEKAKDSTTVQTNPISAQFSFGNIPPPSKSTVESTPQQPAVAQPATDNIFKSIVDKQKSSTWECSSCLTNNSNSVEKCVCCETPKDGSASKDTVKKDSVLSSSSKFTFGSPAASTFSFGSKPESKPTTFQFGSSASNAPSTAAATPSAIVSTASSAFGSSPSKPTFSFGVNKPATSEPAPSSQAAALGGFKFSFGSTAANAPTFGSQGVSKDETDTGTSTKTNTDSAKGITVLENVLVKPAATTNGPILFGQKRTNEDHQSESGSTVAKFSATTSSSNAPTFIFGQPSSVNSTTSAISSSAPSVAQESSAKFSFGGKASAASVFSTVQPSFAATPSPFSFGASSTAPTTTASSTFGSTIAAPSPAPSLNTPSPSQPVFGSNAFSSPSSALPTLGGFNAGSTFGSTSTTPAFGVPSPNTGAQPQATPSPATGIFQFGSNNNSAPIPAAQPSSGGFNFSMSAAPTFNFSEQSTQQANKPYQFGAAPPADIPNIFSAQSSTAIPPRRKLRPVRRVNRP